MNGVMTAKWVWDTNAALPMRTNETGASTFRWFEDPQSQLGTAVASVSKDGEPTWLLADFSGTTLTTAKTAGATSSGKFDPFGNITSGSMSQPLQFHGQYKDTVLGLYDMRQRDYNPVTGMFLSTDPISVAVGDPFISRYSYGFNNPLVFSDASGLKPLGQYDYADGGSYRPVNNGKVTSVPRHTKGRPNPQVTVLPRFQVEDDEMVEDWQLSGFNCWLLDVSGREQPGPRDITKTEAGILDVMFTPSLLHFGEAHDEAFDEAPRRYPEENNDGHQDAFRHAYWSAILANQLTPESATAYVVAHEGSPVNPANREAMDLYNDAVGIGIARANPPFADLDTLSTQVNDGLTSGGLVVIAPDEEFYWSDEVRVGADLARAPRPLNPYLGESREDSGSLVLWGG